MYNYIPHPSNCRVSSHLLKMQMREGVAGYGVYWMLLEMLRDCPNYRTFYFPESFAFAFHVPDVGLVERICKEYGLFEFDDNDYMSCPWLSSVMDEYDEQKKKRSEAGRRGAARRWAENNKDDGKAIALPSVDDGKAIAYNPMLFNATQDNATQPNEKGVKDWREVLSIESPKVTMDIIAALCDTQQPGHNPGYVAQCCCQYGVTEAVFEYICERSDNANLESPVYKKFCALVRRIQQERWKPDHPANFFLSKLFEK